MNVLAIDTSGQALGLCLQTADHRLYTVNHQIGLRHTQTTMVWIDRLLSDRALAVRLAGQARKDVAQYTWEKRAQSLCRIFQHVLARQGDPPQREDAG